jgi:hypothetical protein
MDIESLSHPGCAVIFSGEYITMYQYQRQQIRKRMEEKENQLAEVSLEREELKSKLSQLQSLVTKYMTAGGVRPRAANTTAAAAAAATATATEDGKGD